MTPEVRSRIEDEVRRFATELNLSDPQKAQLRTAFENAEAKLDDNNPPGKVRDSIREQLTKILTPQQLAKWDTEMSKARTFLGHAIRS
jgi:Spy/CpxP family protein refolding chaperone